ncbi:MAG: Uma2 family endonuclease [Planctomycetota bacterium]
MAAALARGGEPNVNLVAILRQHLWDLEVKASVIAEADLVLSEQRVLRSDITVMLEADLQAQRAALSAGADWREHRITVPPTLVVETLLAGHESHDRDLKRRWYTEFGVPYYWMVDPMQQTLEALKLVEGAYVEVARGAGVETVHAEPFAELAIPLGRVWGEA